MPQVCGAPFPPVSGLNFRGLVGKSIDEKTGASFRSSALVSFEDPSVQLHGRLAASTRIGLVHRSSLNTWGCTIAEPILHPARMSGCVLRSHPTDLIGRHPADLSANLGTARPVRLDLAVHVRIFFPARCVVRPLHGLQHAVPRDHEASRGVSRPGFSAVVLLLLLLSLPLPLPCPFCGLTLSSIQYMVPPWVQSGLSILTTSSPGTSFSALRTASSMSLFHQHPYLSK